MKIIVRVKTNANREAVTLLTQPTLGLISVGMDEYSVSVKEPPIDGKANKAIICALAKYFKVAPSLVSLLSGQTSKKKVFDIDI